MEDEVESVAEEEVDKSMAGRHTENGISDIMKELDIVTKFGANLKMFAPSEHVKPQEVVNAFEEQERIEREEEEKRVAQEALFQQLLEDALAGCDEVICEDAIATAFAEGYSELPQLLALGYHRLPPPSPPSSTSSSSSSSSSKVIKMKKNQKKKFSKHLAPHHEQQQQEQELQELQALQDFKKAHRPYGYQKIAKDPPPPSLAHSNSLVLFDQHHNQNQTDATSSATSSSVPVSLSKSLSFPRPLPRVNQADLQCRHDSDLNYEVTYKIKTGKRYTNNQKEDDYLLSYSNITDQPSIHPPRIITSRQGTYEPINTSTSNSDDLVLFEGDSSGSDRGGDGGMLAIADSNMESSSIVDINNNNTVRALEREEEKRREQQKEKELSLSMSKSRLNSVYIEKQHSERRLKEPDWMLMQHRLRLNESIHTQKFVTFEIVSMAKTITLRDTEFIMNKPIIRFGTLDACDYTIKCSNHNNTSTGTGGGGDIRKERALSKIHCMVYVPLISPMTSPAHSQSRHTKTKTGAKKPKKYRKSYDSDSSDSECESDSDEEAEKQSHAKRASQVTIVDNHSCWGTYVVTQQGVKKVPTTIQAGIPLEHGDLICMGITRNGPNVMTAIEANRALLVFRVRTDYCVTIGKVPEFNVGEMIMNEQEKSEKVEKVEYR